MSFKPLKTGRGYFDRAWKPVIKAQRPHWKGPTVTKNLAWLWASRTQAEEDECDRLVANQSVALPTIDPSILPVKSIAKADDPPHPRAAGRGQGVGPAPQPPPPIPTATAASNIAPPLLPSPPPPATPGAAPINPVNASAATGPSSILVRADTEVNTTQFPYWPSRIDNVRLPPAGREGDERWRQFSLLLPGEQQHGKNWHGVLALGEGTGGRATAWVKVDENDTIIDTVAAKDSVAWGNEAMISPINWRDRLPRDIAVQKRLDDQGGLRSIHKFRGYRLSMAQHCYRVYNDLCDKGTFVSAFECYSKQWRMRVSHYRRDVLNDYFGLSDPDKLDDVVQESGFPPKTDGLDVIPEKFLWHTFLDLVDACLLLQDGAGRSLEGNRPWRPIIHKDIHTGNVFLTLPPDCEPVQVDDSEPELNDHFRDYYTPKARNDTTKSCRFLAFTGEKSWPTATLADYDTAFFDLQGEGDIFPDNPYFYWHDQYQRRQETVHGRYAPELFPDHQRYTRARGVYPKMTGAVDVFGIGVIMWNLVRNLPDQPGMNLNPCFDAPDTHGRHLVNGRPYTQADLYDHVLTGMTPYEASDRYSQQLRDAVRSCLAYVPEERPSLEELRNTVQLWMDDDELETEANGPLVIFVDKSTDVLRTGQPYKTARSRKRKRAAESDSEEESGVSA